MNSVVEADERKIRLKLLLRENEQGGFYYGELEA